VDRRDDLASVSTARLAAGQYGPESVLNQEPGRAQAEIKTAYHNASMLYHPDRYGGQKAEAIKALTLAFQRIQEAYETLGNPKKRSEYDLKRPKSAIFRR
jgi:curved DNA-binding protein CbpA